MKTYVGNKPKPSVRDGKWVVTVNRTFVWSGRTGWCALAKFGKWNSPKQFVRPGGNAVVFKTHDDAHELIVRYGLLDKYVVEIPFLDRVGGKVGRFFRTLPAVNSWRPNQIMETALIENGVLVWDSVWVVARGRTFHATHHLPMPSVQPGFVHCFTLEQLFQSAKLFHSHAEAEKVANRIFGELALEVSKHGQIAQLSYSGPDYP